MGSPYLSQNSPAEAFSVGAHPAGYFDIPTAPRMNTLLAGLPPRWNSQWPVEGGLFGPGATRDTLAGVADSQRSGVLDVWKDFPRTLPGMGSSPRQRPGFLREVTNTPAFFLAQSPVSKSALVSPSLPFLAPSAPESSKRLVARSIKKRRLFRARRLAESQAIWLGLYFALNLCLTLYNKGVLVRFPFPYTLTAVHALFGSIGGQALRRKGAYIPTPLNAKSWTVLVAFSVLYAVNIAVSNLSLQLVTIPVSTSGGSYCFCLIAM